jgi:hypothetical protein
VMKARIPEKMLSYILCLEMEKYTGKIKKF